MPAPVAHASSSLASSVTTTTTATSAAALQRAPSAEAGARNGAEEAGGAPIGDDRYERARGGRLILAIEDDIPFAEILRDLAHELDFDFLHATNAASGLALVRDMRPAAVLLDVGLPDRSGLTVLEWLKNDPLTRHIPIHIVSATDHADKALHLGAIGYTLKPTARRRWRRRSGVSKRACSNV